MRQLVPFLIMSALVLYLAENRAQALVRDSAGLTPLHLAAGRGDLAEVRRLVRGGSDLYSVDSRMGVSVLHKAVYSGNAEVVGFLLEKRALVDLQSPSNGNTPLHDAIYFKSGKDLRIIQTLLRHGANLAIRNRAGLVPLESAKALKDEAVINFLDEAARSRSTDSGRELMASVRANDMDRVRALVSREGMPLDEPDEQGFTPLIWASREGFTPIVQLLLEKGADPNREDQWMRANAGHKAAFWGRAEPMALLIKHGLTLNARGGYNGYTALHDAVARGHRAVVEVLLKAGARRDIQGHDGKIPADLARAAGNAELLALLTK